MIKWKPLLIVAVLSIAVLYISVVIDGMDVHSLTTGWAVGALDLMAIRYLAE